MILTCLLINRNFSFIIHFVLHKLSGLTFDNIWPLPKKKFPICLKLSLGYSSKNIEGIKWHNIQVLNNKTKLQVALNKLCSRNKNRKISKL